LVAAPIHAASKAVFSGPVSLHLGKLAELLEVDPSRLTFVIRGEI
jgi:hypothetical protein